MGARVPVTLRRSLLIKDEIGGIISRPRLFLEKPNFGRQLERFKCCIDVLSDSLIKLRSQARRQGSVDLIAPMTS